VKQLSAFYKPLAGACSLDAELATLAIVCSIVMLIDI